MNARRSQIVQTLVDEDVATLVTKDESYGESWRRRGGVGAFMMAARKWDRIEHATQKVGWDVFAAGGAETEMMLGQLGDLRRYLLLIESEIRMLVDDDS